MIIFISLLITVFLFVILFSKMSIKCFIAGTIDMVMLYTVVSIAGILKLFLFVAKAGFAPPAAISIPFAVQLLCLLSLFVLLTGTAFSLSPRNCALFSPRPQASKLPFSCCSRLHFAYVLSNE